jgi:hypothetical protein
LLTIKSAIFIQALIFCLEGSEFSLSKRSCSWNFSKVTKSDALFLAMALSNLNFWSALIHSKMKSEFFFNDSTSQIARIDSIIESFPDCWACKNSWSVMYDGQYFARKSLATSRILSLSRGSHLFSISDVKNQRTE